MKSCHQVLSEFWLIVTLLGMCAMSGCSAQDDKTTTTTTTTSQKESSQTKEVPPPPGYVIPSQQPDVRVRLDRIRNRGQRLILGNDGQPLRITNAQSTTLLGDFSGPVEVYLASDGWRFRESSGRGRVTLPSEALIIRAVPPNNGAAAPISVRSKISQTPRQYPGIFRLVPRSDESMGAWDLINELPIEEYLPGVLSGELYAGWHAQTYGAQAIAARSYAMNEVLARRGRSHFDVESSVRSQVYKGTTTNKESLNAVKRTYGQVLSYQGRLVPGYYASCCGGQPALASEAIGPNPINEMKPLNGHGPPAQCQLASVFHWTRKTTRPLVEERLRSYGKREKNNDLAKLGQLKAIEVTKTNPFGRALLMAITDQQGKEIELGATQLRRALMRGDAQGGRASLQLLSENIRVKVDGDVVSIEGWGFGHGVGLCQYGAQAMAQAGDEANVIAEFYYPGAKVVKAYGVAQPDSDSISEEADKKTTAAQGPAAQVP